MNRLSYLTAHEPKRFNRSSMDNSNQPVTAAQPDPLVPQPVPLSEPLKQILNTPPHVSFLTRLFTGRVSRSGYIAGILTVGIALTAIAMLLFALLSLVFDRTLETAFLLGMVFIVMLFYAFSLSLRRLHDLNKSGWFLLFFLPGEIGTFFFLVVTFAGSVNVSVLHLLQAIPSYVDITFTVIRWIANVFTIYMLLWPGTSEPNKYGHPTGKLNLKEILGFSNPKPVEQTEPQTESIASSNNY